jgi:O-antigen/teichoic acid export membrane protein
MGLAFLPLYVKYLGAESYGLIGLFAVMQASLSLLDVGLTSTLSREMARFTGGARSAASIRDLLRSVEIITVGLVMLLAVGIWIISDWLASDWLRAETLSTDVVSQAFVMMGGVAALRFVEGIYRSAIVGLQRQVLFNVVSSVLATLRGLGAVGILVWWSPTLEAFFIWQGLVSVLSLGVLARLTYRSIPLAERAGQFSLAELRGIGKFVSGVMGIKILAVLLTQIDKVLLARLLPLSELGLYTVASTVAGALFLITGPIIQAWTPRLNQLRAADNEIEFIKKFHQGAQLVSVFAGSAALILMFFSPVILQIWFRDQDLVQRNSDVLAILALGNGLNCLMWIPYQAQLAYGRIKLSLWINLVSVMLIVPAILSITPRYGAEGAAWIWVTLNAGYVLVSTHFMFRKVLSEEKWRWYVEDLLKPLCSGVLVAAACAWNVLPTQSMLRQGIWLLTSSALIMFATALASSSVRTGLITYARRRFGCE